MRQLNTKYLDKRGLAAAIALTAAAIFLPDSASAQTVQCASAFESAELEICNNEDLTILEEKMSRLNAVRKITFTNQPNFQELSKDTQRWIEKRNLCGLDAECIEQHYIERINKLSKQYTLWSL